MAVRDSRWGGATIDHAVSSSTVASAGRAFMELPFALENRNLECDLAPLANDADDGGAADAGIRDELHEMTWIDHVLTVKGHDDVAKFKSGLVRGRAPVDIIDERAGRLGYAKLLRDLRRYRIQNHPADRSATYDAVLDDLAD